MSLLVGLENDSLLENIIVTRRWCEVLDTHQLDEDVIRGLTVLPDVLWLAFKVIEGDRSETTNGVWDVVLRGQVGFGNEDWRILSVSDPSEQLVKLLLDKSAYLAQA